MFNPRLLQPLLLTIGCFLLGCRPHHPSPSTTRLASTHPTTHPTTHPSLPHPPLLDLRHGTGSFPLDSRPITSAASLSSSLHAGYLTRLTPPNPDFITLQGTLSHLNLLRIDVSNAQIRPDYKPAAFTKTTHVDRTFTVHHLEYIAHPLHYQTASADIHLTADDAQLDLLHDSKKVAGLVLSSARRGQFQLHITSANLNHFLTDPHSSDVSVLRTTFSLTSDSPHTLSVTLDLRARWLLLPMTLSLHGQVSASPDGTLTFSNLSATGYDPGGLLAAAFLNPPLHKLNGTSQPALSFPDPKTHVTNVTFNLSDGLTFTIDFGQQ